MDKQIRNLIEIANGILNYAEGRKGVLDEKAKADLRSMIARLTLLATERRGRKEGLSLSKAEAAKEVEQLKNAILRARRLLDAASVGSKSGIKTPRSTKGMFSVSRIHATGVNHIQELEKMKSDPSLAKSLSAVNAAMESFDVAYGNVKAQKVDRRDMNGEHKEELAVIAGKLMGYKMFAMYSVPSADRKDLRRLIHDLVPEKANRKQEQDGSGATATPLPTAVPALPTIPGVTAVPQTGDHPQLSANA